ncbi:WXG100 family type VII secretion target [Rhodococcus rhodochrous]|uniref:WXG100 family type VII secretion target n=1 Tax=Rhodococcus rhodochrous TaxID=1829 RepID=UPI000AAB753D|nr:WXG100 family type VII secretion target [Rhodococcus rhodochrous]
MPDKLSHNENPIESMLAPLLDPAVPDRVDALTNWHTSLVARLDGSFDPDYATVFENFHGMEHDAIYRDVQTMDPGAMRSLAESWRTIATDMSVGFIFGTQMICKKIAEGWDGEAARQAVAATRSFAKSAEQLVAALLAVSTKLAAASEIATAVRTNVQPPPARIPLPSGVVVPQDAAEFARAAEAARTEAVRVMESLYVPHYRESGTAVPILPSPHEATAGSGPAGSSPARHAADATNTADSADGRGGGSEPAGADSDGGPATGTPSTDAPATDRPAAPSGPAADGAESATTVPAATTTAGAATAPERYPGGVPGGPGGATSGGGGVGAGPGGAGAPGLGGPGPVGGVPTANGTTGSATSGPGTRAGSARASGMYPGMLGAPARPARDDEAARTVPSYLVGVDNGNELIGPMPLTAPPVLGVDPA